MRALLVDKAQSDGVCTFYLVISISVVKTILYFFLGELSEIIVRET